MNIVIIGSGNVAAVLGRKFVTAGHRIVQVMSRNASEASALAYEWDTESANYFSLIDKSADVYIIAVSDSAISFVAENIFLGDKVVAHTAAAVKMDVLKNVSSNYGVFYPLQSLRKEQKEIPGVPIFTESVNAYTQNVLESLGQSIYPHQNSEAGFDKRVKLHIAAVLVNNFTNHIFVLAEQFCKKEGIDFSDMLPLIEHTFARLHQASPSNVQTGPAARGDMETIKTHIEILQQYPALQKLYQFFSESILNDADKTS